MLTKLTKKQEELIAMKIVYIAHPIGGDVENNLKDLRRIIRKINLEYPEVIPFCPYYADVVSMDDHNPSERERGIKNDQVLLCSGCVDELWLTGDRVSDGMREEVELAHAQAIPVVYYLNFF